jgi:putative alpha-1,2-mannosidase
MVQSMIQDYQEGGWLPMWKNIQGMLHALHFVINIASYDSLTVETNIMVGTHADSLIAEAVFKEPGFVKGFDAEKAWEAIWKDATVPPVKDQSVR